MKLIFLIISATAINTFFAATTVLGYKYEGAENDSLYLIYSALIAFFVYSLVAVSALQQRLKFFRTDWLFFAIPLFFLMSFLGVSLFDGDFNLISSRSFQGFFLWAVPALWAGFYISRKNLVARIYRPLEVVALLFAASSLYYLFRSFGDVAATSDEGLILYQTASYHAAFAFGLILFFVAKKDGLNISTLSERSLYRGFLIGLLPLMVLTVLISGGRGGLVLVVAYLLLRPLMLGQRLIRTLGWSAVALLLAALGVLAFEQFFSTNEALSRGAGRIFLFLAQDASASDATSGRDEVYLSALNLIADAPLFGYGLFGYLSKLGYPPHNILLEIVLGGGLVGLVFAGACFFSLLSRQRRIVKQMAEFRVVYFFALFPLVHLMFSGSYLINSEIWFAIGMVLGWRPNDRVSRTN